MDESKEGRNLISLKTREDHNKNLEFLEYVSAGKMWVAARDIIKRLDLAESLCRNKGNDLKRVEILKFIFFTVMSLHTLHHL